MRHLDFFSDNVTKSRPWHHLQVVGIT